MVNFHRVFLNVLMNHGRDMCVKFPCKVNEFVHHPGEGE
jgi:hypothetical protein